MNLRSYNKDKSTQMKEYSINGVKLTDSIKIRFLKNPKRKNFMAYARYAKYKNQKHLESI